MPLSISVKPGKVFQAQEKVTPAKLNQLGQMVVTLSGSSGPTDLTAGDYSLKLLAGPYFFATSVFAANIYGLAMAAAPLSYLAGTWINFVADAANTGACSAQLAGLAAKHIYKHLTQELAAGDIRTGQAVTLFYDGTNFQMVSPTGNTANYYFTDTGAANAYAVAAGVFLPVPAALADLIGKPIRIKAANANTGASTFQAGALAATAIKKNLTDDLAANDIKAGQIFELVYDGAVFQFQSRLGTTADTAVVASARNLIAQPNAGAANNKVDVSADMVVLMNAANVPFLAVNVAVTADITVAGLNGLDTGAEAGSTWYYVWLIYNGATVGSLLSVSSTAPTLPAGYTYKALVGCVRNNGASNFVNFYQAGREVVFASQNIFNAKQVAAALAVLTGGDVTAFQAAVPPIAVRVAGTFGSATTLAYAIMQIATDTSGLGAQVLNVGSGIASGFNYSAGVPFSLLIKGQNLAIAGDNTAGRCRLDVSGFSI